MNVIKRIDEYIHRNALSEASGIHKTYLSFLSKRESLPVSSRAKVISALESIIDELTEIESELSEE